METPITLTSGALTLEGWFEKVGNGKGVAITHPHSLYGGNMDNQVVKTLIRAYRRAGFSTLRFNFRGVGNSTGFFDQGAGEVKDVMAALAFLADQGIETLYLAGYSFGAWVNARVDCAIAGVKTMIAVSPPVAFMDYGDKGTIPSLSLVVTGSEDEIAPPAMIREMMPVWNPNARLDVISGADHFYGVHLDALEDAIYSSISA